MPSEPEPARQPVHTFYGGAHLFQPGVCAKLGLIASRSLDRCGPPLGIAEEVITRVRAKLATEPVEDYRIDFEDGYGARSEEQEARDAIASACAAAHGLRDGLLPPFFGIRIKPVDGEHYTRSHRTLHTFLTSLCNETAGKLPANFVVTLPKVKDRTEILKLTAMLAELELALSLPEGQLRFEFLVETPQALLSLPELIAAGGGRAVAAHFGAYDYLACIGIAATQQRLHHPACDFARNVMQAALADKEIFLADGVTNVLPVGDCADVLAGWRLHMADVRHSLEHGFYQGWDVHPAQLVSRYAAVYSFFRDGLSDVIRRLKSFAAASERSALTGTVFDDLATIRGLRAYVNRAVSCGAIEPQEISFLNGF